mgnify:CR=1 FL=1
MDETMYMLADFMQIDCKETEQEEKERKKYQEEFVKSLARALAGESGKKNGERLRKALYQISDAMVEICKDIAPEKMRFSVHKKRKTESGGTAIIKIEQIKYREKMLMTWTMEGGNAPERLEEKMKIQEMLVKMDRMKESIQKWMDGEEGKGNIAEDIENVREITDELEDLFVISGEATEKTKEEWKEQEERSLRIRRERAERRRKAIGWIMGDNHGNG